MFCRFLSACPPRLSAVCRHNLLGRLALPDDPQKEHRPGQFNAGVERSHILPASARRTFPLYSALPDVERRQVVEDKMRAITPNHNQIRCDVVTTYEQMLHAYAIRSICFMEEHGVEAQADFRWQRLPVDPYDRVRRRPQIPT